MAKYEVVHSCTHSETVNLVGVNKDRERKMAWLEQQPCPACVQAERVKVAQGLAELQSAKGLPSLSGSEKQATWAVQIRHAFLFACEKLEKRLEECVYSDSPSAPVAEQLLFELDELRSKWKKERYAQTWIDKRSELTESGVSSTLSVVRDQIADKITAPITKDFPLSDADKREVLKLAIENRRAELEQKRQTELASREAQREAVASAKEAAKQAELEAAWHRKDSVAALVPESSRPAYINVWNRDSNEKRVYFESGRNKVCLYVTGNKYNRPGSLRIEAGNMDADAIRPCLEMAARQYKTARIDVAADGTAK